MSKIPQFNLYSAFFLTILTLTPSLTFKHRSKRLLSFRHFDQQVIQTICDFGFPVDLEVESVTIGYAIKSNFYLPTNSTSFFGSLGDPFEKLTSPNFVVGRSDNKYEKVTSGYEDEQNERFERSMIKADVVESGTIENDIDDSNLGNNFATTRFLVYKGLAQMAEIHGLEGRSCVLRSFCESAHVPFDHSNGILGELFHVILTPSLTKDKIIYYEDNEFLRAEQLGKEGAPCDRIFEECKLSLLDQFSGIYSSN